MALPFLAKKENPQAMTTTRLTPEDFQEKPQEDNGLEACAQDMLQAFEMKDAKGLAAAFQAAFQILEAQPHEEAGHDNDMEGQE